MGVLCGAVGDLPDGRGLLAAGGSMWIAAQGRRGRDGYLCDTDAEHVALAAGGDQRKATSHPAHIDRKYAQDIHHPNQLI